MAIVRFDPFRELSEMQDRMGRMLGGLYGQRGADDVMRRGAWIPPVDIYDSGNHELVIKAELPDMKREDIQLTVDANTLTISGEKRMDGDMKEDNCHRVERAYGTFMRSFSLPPTVDGGKVSADYKAGVLTVRLPMREEAKPRQIQVSLSE
ncbi:MAG TPA: Hsp20/alpha crystallin family protein [Vicinamibacterales bacterium]